MYVMYDNLTSVNLFEYYFTLKLIIMSMVCDFLKNGLVRIQAPPTIKFSFKSLSNPIKV